MVIIVPQIDIVEDKNEESITVVDIKKLFTVTLLELHLKHALTSTQWDIAGAHKISLQIHSSCLSLTLTRLMEERYTMFLDSSTHVSMTISIQPQTNNI